MGKKEMFVQFQRSNKCLGLNLYVSVFGSTLPNLLIQTPSKDARLVIHIPDKYKNSIESPELQRKDF